MFRFTWYLIFRFTWYFASMHGGDILYTVSYWQRNDNEPQRCGKWSNYFVELKMGWLRQKPGSQQKMCVRRQSSKADKYTNKQLFQYQVLHCWNVIHRGGSILLFRDSLSSHTRARNKQTISTNEHHNNTFPILRDTVAHAHRGCSFLSTRSSHAFVPLLWFCAHLQEVPSSPLKKLLFFLHLSTEKKYQTKSLELKFRIFLEDNKFFSRILAEKQLASMYCIKGTDNTVKKIWSCGTYSIFYNLKYGKITQKLNHYNFQKYHDICNAIFGWHVRVRRWYL